MSQAGAGFDQIPYYREYLEQILKPRVLRAVEEVKGQVLERVWAELVAKMADDQNPGAASDHQARQQIRAMLEQGLQLQLSAAVNASFGTGVAAAPAGVPAPSAAPAPARTEVEQGFPDNPLARAVGGVRRLAR